MPMTLFPFSGPKKLRKAPKWTDIRISSDRTPKQREVIFNLREELSKWKNNGDQDLTIKYLKGIPTIVISKSCKASSIYTRYILPKCPWFKYKINFLNAHISYSNFNVYVFTETWLSNYINTSELSLNNYNIYKYVRNVHTSSLSREGGVLIATHNKLDSKLLNIPLEMP